MPLRKSPERTAALLAANRANGRKFNGLHDLSRQQRDLLNGLRDGGRLARSLETLARAPLRQQLDFAQLYASLHKAVAPEPSEVDLVLAAAAFVWRVKRRMEHRVRSPRFKAQVAAQDGRLPPPWQMPLLRPAGQVTVTVWVRPGRPPVPGGQASGVGQPKDQRVQKKRRGNGQEKGQESSQFRHQWDQQSPLYVGSPSGAMAGDHGSRRMDRGILSPRIPVQAHFCRAQVTLRPAGVRLRPAGLRLRSIEVTSQIRNVTVTLLIK